MTQPTADDPTRNSNEGEGNEGTGSEGEGTGADPGRTFTAADVDRIVRERLGRERGKYADYAALKDKAAKFDDIEKANQSELERERAAREKAEREVAAATERVTRTLIRAELTSAATRAGAIDPSDIVALLGGSPDIKVDAEGKVEGVSAAVDALVKSKPHLFSGAAGKGNAGPNGGASRQSDQGARGKGGAPAATVASGRDMWATRRASKASANKS